MTFNDSYVTDYPVVICLFYQLCLKLNIIVKSVVNWSLQRYLTLANESKTKQNMNSSCSAKAHNNLGIVWAASLGFVCVVFTFADWAGRGVILHSKALPGITVTVSWTSGISSASSLSQLSSYKQTHIIIIIRLGLTKLTQTVRTLHVQTGDSQNYSCHKFNTSLKQHGMSLQGIMVKCWQWTNHTLHLDHNLY